MASDHLPRAVVVLLAAGAGRRLGAVDQPKAFVPIGGRPILSVAAAAAAAASAVARLVVTVPQGWEDYAEGCVEFCGAPCSIVTGGSTRQGSVRVALEQIEDAETIVIVHDAARPFASPDLFSAVAAEIAGPIAGAIPVVPVADTVKRVQDDVVTQTLEREELRLAQTPQAFDATALKESHEAASSAGSEFTDDAAVMEAMGHRIRAVPGDPLNTKITTLFDLAQAEARMGGLDG